MIFSSKSTFDGVAPGSPQSGPLAHQSSERARSARSAKTVLLYYGRRLEPVLQSGSDGNTPEATLSQSA